MSDGYIEDDEAFAALPATDHSWLTQYVHHGARVLASPVIFHVATGLAVLAATCPHRMAFGAPAFIRPTLPNIYAMAVGESGGGKTHAVELGRDFLRAACPDLVPSLPGSDEHFVRSLETNPVQILVYGDFGHFLSVTTDGNYRAPLRASYTEAFEGSPISSQTLKRKFHQEHPQPSILAACTPRHLVDFTYGVDWEGGFMSRFFIGFGSRTRAQHFPGSDEIRRVWLLSKITEMARCANAGPCLGFDAQSAKLWTDFQDAVEVQRRAAPERSRGAIGRTILHACKILILLSWDYGKLRSGEPWEISWEIARPAIALARLHLRAVNALVDRIAPTSEARVLQEVLSAIGPTWTPLPAILHEVPMQLRTLKQCLATHVAGLRIEETMQGAVAYYRQIKTEMPVYDAQFAASPPPNIGLTLVGGPGESTTPGFRVLTGVDV